MCKDSIHEHLAITLAPMLGEDEDVHEVGEGRVVGDDASKRDLGLAEEAAKAERVVNSPLHQGKWNALGPVGLLRKEPVDEREIQLSSLK